MTVRERQRKLPQPGTSLSSSRISFAFATFFGCGRSRFAPGTVGSLAAILIAWPLSRVGFGPVHFVILALALLWPAILSSGIVATQTGRKDPQIVVIDEVLGQWLTLAGAARFNLLTFGMAFVLFRLFDIWKPPPIRRIERIPGGAGIVLDDIMAGVYGALVLFIAGWFNRQ